MRDLKENKLGLDLPSFFISGGVLLLFVLLAVIDSDFIANSVDYLFGLSATYFGIIYQVVLLGTFLIALVLAFSKYGNICLGKMDKVEISIFNCISIIIYTLLVLGEVFLLSAVKFIHLLSFTLC